MAARRQPLRRRCRAPIIAIIAILATLGALNAAAAPGQAAVSGAASAPIRKVTRMSLDHFWAIVDSTTADEANPPRQLESLRTALRKLSTEELLAYEATFDQVMTNSYSWDLWGAAYVVHGGASDDGFEYFRCWLVSKGRRVFEKVSADPDSLADLLTDDVEGVLEFESFAYVARKVWHEKTGNAGGDMPGAALMMYIGRQPTGTPFGDDAASLARRYPKLWRRFGSHPLG